MFMKILIINYSDNNVESKIEQYSDKRQGSATLFPIEFKNINNRTICFDLNQYI